MLLGEMAVAQSVCKTGAFILVLLLFPFLVNVPFQPNLLETASQLSVQKNSPPLPYGGEPVGQYTGQGAVTTILSSYNKTLSTPTSTNDTQDFIITLPVNWETSFNASITDITAKPIVLDVETNDTLIEGSHTIRAAMSFQISNSCYLYSVMVRIAAGMFELLDSLEDLYIRIYNATEDSGRPKPDYFWSSRIYFDLGESTDTFDGWINATWISPVYLTTTNTYNNFFFVVLVPESGATPSWQFRADSSNGDQGHAWRFLADWTYFPVDYFLNVSLLPMGLSPNPSQVSMQINGTAVTDAVGNNGWWASSFTVSTSRTYFNITASWPITFDYTYIALFSRNFIGTTDFSSNDQLSLAIWNITTFITFPNVNADANSRTINFSLPAYWEAQALFNGTTLKPFSRFQDNSTNPGVPGWLFLDEPGGAGNGTLWRVVSSDLNYVQTPVIWRGASDVTGTEVNITDTLFVTSQVTTFTNGEGRFNPYDETGTSLNQWFQSPDGSGLLTFPSFTPTSYSITNVTMRCEIVWNNSYHAGVGLSSVDLVYPTTVTDDMGPYTSLIGDSVIIRVFYEDAYNVAGITDAEVNVTFDGTTYALNDAGSGYYQNSINTGTMGLTRGVHTGVVTADRSGYEAATTSVSLTLWSMTQLDANWTIYSINYTESVTLEVNYSVLTPIGEGGITGAIVNISGPWFSDLTEVGGGNYSVVLDGTVLGVGTHNLLVNASKPGLYYQARTLPITLIVNGEPTTISGSAPVSVDGGDAFNVTVTYRKQSDGSGITGATLSCWVDEGGFSAFTLYDLANGTYKLQFVLNASINPALFNITITASRGGYYNSTYTAFVSVQLRASMITVEVISSLPVLSGNDFVIRVTYQDGLSQGLIGAIVQGNWTVLGFTDDLNGNYTVQCQTTGVAVGWWTINFNISVQNYAVQYFTEGFPLIWATSLTPENDNYSPSEYQNETLVLDVTFSNENTGLGIDSATVWVIFQSQTHYLVSMGSGVYRLTLNLSGISPSNYPLNIQAQRNYHQNQTLNVNLAVLAKNIPSLTVSFPTSEIYEGTTNPVTIILTFANGTPIVGAEVDVTVWIHHVNGTDLTLHSELITTDGLGMHIIPVQLPTYSSEFWSSGNDAPYLWAEAAYNGCREVAASTVRTSTAISPVGPLPPWVLLLIQLLPFLIVLIIVIIVGWTIYAKRVRPKKLAKLKALEHSGGQWAQRMMDLMDLRALFVMYSKTGLPIFTYNFAGGGMPSALLSGFIAAVNAFYTELSGELDRESQLRDIHYKDIHLSLREGRHSISVLILDSSPSEGLTQSLAGFTQNFETKFASELETFDGRIDVFDPASEIVEESFHGELLMAYECVKTPSRGFARKIYDFALKLAGEDGRIYIPQLFVAAVEKFGSKKKFDIANALEKLHEDGCLAPVNTSLHPQSSKDEPAESST